MFRNFLEKLLFNIIIFAFIIKILLLKYLHDLCIEEKHRNSETEETLFSSFSK